MLISANDDDTEDEDTRVTLHHNWFKETKQRHPRIRHGKLHAYNNFIDSWGDYGMGCSTNSECYSESNVFQAGDDSDAILTQVGEDDGHGEVESHGDLVLGWAFVEERGSVFTPSDFYDYSAEGTTHLAESIQSGAGAR
jgi:pectate lyase